MALEDGLAHNESAGYYRVWIHNRSTKDVTKGVGMYMGAGGPGTFLSLAKDTPTEAQKPHMYRWTRYTSCKQDKAEMANAQMILNTGKTHYKNREFSAEPLALSSATSVKS